MKTSICPPSSFLFLFYSITIVWGPAFFHTSARTSRFASAAFSTGVPRCRTRTRIPVTNNNNDGMKGWQTTGSFSQSTALFASRSKSADSGVASTTTKYKQDTNEDDGASTTTTTTTNKVLNLSTVHKDELESILVEGWGYPRYRADQVWNWIRVRGVTNVSEMNNLPAKLRRQLEEFTKPSALEVVVEQVSQKDGTIKRAYRCADGQVIESVLMGPYDDGRYTACISSQAGCAQGCVFCATGQMGFRRQLSADEILEQVARFAAELQNKQVQQQKNKNTNVNNNNNNIKQPRLSNIVFMGMGEPLSNYKHVKTAINRIITELGIGARRITVSTVGIVPRIRQMWQDPEMPSGVRLAVSLHCASDEERDALLPANRRYGGLDELLKSLQEYQEGTNRRITLEWALIEGTNDSVETARKLGNLLTKRGQLRRDLLHINVIPLNPTSWHGGRPSRRGRVNRFCQVLQEEFRIACTPRVRRGIDIDAGCGQLTTQIQKEEDEAAEVNNKVKSLFSIGQVPQVGVYDDDDDDEYEDEDNMENIFKIDPNAVDFESADDYEDPEFSTDFEKQEAARLVALVQGTTTAVPVMRDETSNQKRQIDLTGNLKAKNRHP